MSETSRGRRVVLATRNRHKVVEINELMSGAGLDIIGIDEVAPGTALFEDEDTFEGNALAKARQAALATGLPALADDSGLEVDALGGAPGVFSARYAGEPSDDQRNNDKLLDALTGVPPERRAGRYRCVAAYVDPGAGIELVGTGSCEGHILERRQGSGGFGYDPLFLIPALGKSMAEISLDVKNGLSHRAAAFKALRALLQAPPPG